MNELTAKPGTLKFLQLDPMEELVSVARDVWEAWNDEHMCLPNQMQCLRDALARVTDVESYSGQQNPRIAALELGERMIQRAARRGWMTIWNDAEGEYELQKMESDEGGEP